MDKIELRVLSSNLAVTDEEMVVEGLVNQTNAWSHTLGLNKRFREKVDKGVFTRAINQAPRIDFLAEHRTDLLLATTENSSLELWEDDEGLKMRAKIAPTSYGKDFYTLVKEKMINHMSFGFKVVKDEWRKASDGIYERTVSNLQLREVSLVRNPAYPQTAIAARGIDVIEDVEIPSDIEDLEERAIDIEALKAEIKKEVLAEVAALKSEEKPEIEEVQPEVKPEVVPEVEAKTETEVEVKPEVVVESKIEEKVEDKPTDNQVIKPEVKPDVSATSLVDLLQKYKELQNFK